MIAAPYSEPFKLCLYSESANNLQLYHPKAEPLLTERLS